MELEQVPQEVEAGQVTSEEEISKLLAMVDDLDEDNIDPELINRLYAETLKNFEEGELVTGTVVRIDNGEVLVDVGYKSEGIIPLSEFNDLEEGASSLEIGHQVEVLLERKEDSEGLVILSKEKANKIKLWEHIASAYHEGTILKGKVMNKVKGGLTVDIGLPAFLPGSQIDLRPVRDLDSLLRQTIDVKVLKLNPKRGNIVVSRRASLEKEREDKRREILKLLKEGQIIRGIVKNITDYGAFIDLGGLDGLLHITDMSWGRVRHPSELFAIGDKVDVVVLKFDHETQKVSLGVKQKTQDPWETVAQKYPSGTRINGKVVNLVEYGAFVELEEGVEGLIHISEMSWTRKIRHPSKLLAVGDAVEAVILDVDKDNKRISLGLKQTEPNPWEVVAQKYKVSDIITGRVRNLTDFGAFIEIEEGIDGLLHISDMSWTQRVKHPSEIIKRGATVEVVILNIDPTAEKLSLGLKQLMPDPWKDIPLKYVVGTVIRRKISRLTDFGAFVEVESGIEGLIHVSELDAKVKAAPRDLLQVGDEVEMMVIRIEPATRKISLSIRAYQESQARDELKEYLNNKEQAAAEFENKVLTKDVIKPDSTEPKVEPEEQEEIITEGDVS